MKKLILFIITGIILYSCGDDPLTVEENVNKFDKSHIAFFQYDYGNSAWGFQHNGFFINRQGECKIYSLDQDKEWNEADSMGYISYEALYENYKKATELFLNISIDTVREMEYLSLNLKGGLEEKVHSMADAGIATTIAYKWDSSRKMYRRIILEMNGDFKAKHSDPNAAIISDWIKNTGEKYHSFRWYEGI